MSLTSWLPCPWCDVIWPRAQSSSCPLCGREPPRPTRDPGPDDADVVADGEGPRVVDLRDLSRRQQREYDEDRQGVAEELVAEAYGLAHRPDRADWFDAVLEASGTKYEVKSTGMRIGDEYPAPGRFRLRRDQTRSLVASDAQGTAWYAFVLFDEDAGEAYIQRRRPATVAGIVEDRGGWNEAGHDEFDRQHKLPYDEVVNP